MHRVDLLLPLLSSDGDNDGLLLDRPPPLPHTGVVLVQPKVATMARMVQDGLLDSDMPPATRTTTYDLQDFDASALGCSPDPGLMPATLPRGPVIDANTDPDPDSFRAPPALP